ncbi:MAG: hypothetical protein KAI83_20160 [Thiomargarita sp.]|nr:hypothetical protein [Thiomargarita sp.]
MKIEWKSRSDAPIVRPILAQLVDEKGYVTYRVIRRNEMPFPAWYIDGTDVPVIGNWTWCELSELSS